MQQASGTDLGLSWHSLREATWQLAEDGFGPLQGAHALAARIQRRWPHDTGSEQIERLLASERRKQFVAALALAAVSSVALPAGLPASLAAAHLLDARLALSIALLLGYSLEAPGVREALQEAVLHPPLGSHNAGATSAKQAAPSRDLSAEAGFWPHARLLVEYAAPKALRRGQQLLLRYGSGRWQRRLMPVIKALPAASHVVLAAFEARAMRGLAGRVEARLGRLPTEATRATALAVS